jgi:fructoselysine-6-P-deglycase FrlB-like protein
VNEVLQILDELDEISKEIQEDPELVKLWHELKKVANEVASAAAAAAAASTVVVTALSGLQDLGEVPR